jgi:hypothetical protein
MVLLVLLHGHAGESPLHDGVLLLLRRMYSQTGIHRVAFGAHGVLRRIQQLFVVVAAQVLLELLDDRKVGGGEAIQALDELDGVERGVGVRAEEADVADGAGHVF